MCAWYITSWLSRTETFTIKIVDGRLAVLINPISVHYIQILRKLQQPKKQNKMVKKTLLQNPKKCFMKSIVTFHPVSLLNYLLLNALLCFLSATSLFNPHCF